MILDFNTPVSIMLLMNPDQLTLFNFSFKGKVLEEEDSYYPVDLLSYATYLKLEDHVAYHTALEVAESLLNHSFTYKEADGSKVVTKLLHAVKFSKYGLELELAWNRDFITLIYGSASK